MLLRNSEKVNLIIFKMIRKNRRTSAEVASLAGKKLSDPNTTKEEKSLAGSALVQRRWY
jgi:hypothetical protein